MDGLLAMGLALITVGIGYNLKTKLVGQKVELIKAKATPTVVQINSKVVFDISGEVLKPGVYKLPKGSRVSEAMMMAGGLALNADREWVERNINLAKVIGDGEKIYIPKKISNDKLLITNETTKTETIKINQQVLGSQIININTAGVEELDKLSGVGPAIAQKIIDYRDMNGGFKDVNEIKMVSGIGDKMFEKIKDQIGI